VVYDDGARQELRVGADHDELRAVVDALEAETERAAHAGAQDAESALRALQTMPATSNTSYTVCFLPSFLESVETYVMRGEQS